MTTMTMTTTLTATKTTTRRRHDDVRRPHDDTTTTTDTTTTVDDDNDDDDDNTRVKYTYRTPTKFPELFRPSKLLQSYHYVHSMVRVCSSMGVSFVNP